MSSLRQQRIDSLQLRKGAVKPIYRLRWCFHFVNGKVRYGIWNGASNNFSDTAASVNKTGLLVAQIQGEHFDGNAIQVLYQCDGHDYVTAKWNAAVGAGAPIGEWKVDAIKLEPDIIGLTFLTRKERVSVFVNGSVSQRRHRTDDKFEKIREHNLT